MTQQKLCLALCLSLLPALAFAAAPKDRTTELPTPVAVAAISQDSEDVMLQPVALATATENLPDLPPIQTRTISFRQPPLPSLPVNRTSRISFGKPQSAGVSPLASMPLAGAARRMGAEHFNTDDGSMLDDFAICFRTSGRTSIEVIPGDPAPVKLPVVTMANSTGVTVGLVVRLTKQ
jgi:hypothetical protein